MKIPTAIEILFASVGGFLGYWLGGFDLLLKTMLALSVIDYVTGTGTAIYTRSFKASICCAGIFKKVYMYITVAVAVIVQHFLGDAIPVREIVISYYIFYEGMSALENIGKVVPYPEKLKQIFSELNGDEVEVD